MEMCDCGMHECELDSDTCFRCKRYYKPRKVKKVSKVCSRCKSNKLNKNDKGKHHDLCQQCYREMSRPRRNSNWKADKVKKLKFMIRQYVTNMFGYSCMSCGLNSRRVVVQIDHIMPISYFPELEFDLNNLQVLCGRCNLRKSNHAHDDFRTDSQKARMKSFTEVIGTNDVLVKFDNIYKKNLSNHNIVSDHTKHECMRLALLELDGRI